MDELGAHRNWPCIRLTQLHTYINHVWVKIKAGKNGAVFLVALSA